MHVYIYPPDAAYTLKQRTQMSSPHMSRPHMCVSTNARRIVNRCMQMRVRGCIITDAETRTSTHPYILKQNGSCTQWMAQINFPTANNTHAYTRVHRLISQGMTTVEGVTGVSSECDATGDCGKRETNEKKWREPAFCRAERLRYASTSQRVEGGDEGEGEAINSLTSLNVHLMMHT